MKFDKYGEYILCEDSGLFFIDRIISINYNESSVYLNLQYWYDTDTNKIIKETYTKYRYSISHFGMLIFTSDNLEECLDKMKIMCEVSKYNL